MGGAHELVIVVRGDNECIGGIDGKLGGGNGDSESGIELFKPAGHFELDGQVAGDFRLAASGK